MLKKLWHDDELDVVTVTSHKSNVNSKQEGPGCDKKHQDGQQIHLPLPQWLAQSSLEVHVKLTKQSQDLDDLRKPMLSMKSLSTDMLLLTLGVFHMEAANMMYLRMTSQKALKTDPAISTKVVDNAKLTAT